MSKDKSVKEPQLGIDKATVSEEFVKEIPKVSDEPYRYSKEWMLAFHRLDFPLPEDFNRLPCATLRSPVPPVSLMSLEQLAVCSPWLHFLCISYCISRIPTVTISNLCPMIALLRCTTEEEEDEVVLELLSRIQVDADVEI